MKPEESSEIRELLSELVTWARIQGTPKVKELLADNLQKPLHRRIYHHSTGIGAREVGELAGCTHPAVIGLWKKLSKIGLMRETRGHSGRYEKSFELESFDLDTGGEVDG